MKRLKHGRGRRWIAVLLLCCFVMQSVAIEACASSFSDVSDQAWYAQDVELVQDLGLMTGTGNHQFNPNGKLTRAMFVTILYRAFYLWMDGTSDGNAVFSDVPSGEWYSDAVAWAGAAGIVTGYADGSFGPHKAITREQVAAILYRFFSTNSSVELTPSESTISAFSDSAQISGWARTAVEWLREYGVFAGDAKGRFRPLNSMTRAEAAAVFVRILLQIQQASDQMQQGVQDFSQSYYVSDQECIYNVSHLLTLDDASNTLYYSGMIVAFLWRAPDEIDLTMLSDASGGTIVGMLDDPIHVVQIRCDTDGLAELQAAVDRVMETGLAFYANVETPMELSVSAAASADMKSDSRDWWVSAVGADRAWKYLDQCEPITVGIMDDGFYLDNASLNGQVLQMLSENSPSQHGTAVASVMAGTDTSGGVRGIAPQARLLLADNRPGNAHTSTTTLSSLEYIWMTKRMIEQGAKVINCSFGNTFYDKDHYQECAIAFDSYESYVDTTKNLCRSHAFCCAALMVGMMLSGEKDFLIVQGAGNGFNNGGGTGVDASLYSSYYASITEDVYRSFFNPDQIKAIESYGVTYRDLEDRILIVGAVVNQRDGNGNYLMADVSNTDGMFSSNYGPTVDICAPGYQIWSAVGTNEYAYMDGTSLATPIVAGAAALLWSLDPSMSAAQVRDALLTSSKVSAIGVGSSAGRRYPMLDIGAAVQAVASAPSDGSGSAAQQAQAAYDKLLQEKQYLQDGSGLDFWQEIGMPFTPGEYSVFDVNGDGIPELLINGKADNGLGGWFISMLYTYDTAKAQPLFVMDWYYYGDIKYSAEHQALCYSSIRPSMLAGSVEYMGLRDQELVPVYTVAWSEYLDNQMYYYTIWEDESTHAISQSQKDEELALLQPITFQPLP